MNRNERIRKHLGELMDSGVIQGEIMIQGSMPGKRWTFTPNGFSERAMTTNEVEWFILGAQAARKVIWRIS